MSSEDVARVATRPRPPGRLGRLAPWPLVGVALLLVTLVILTPVLITNSHQPGPGLLTQAEVVVDKISANATFHFYVWALGETIRYAKILVGVATSFDWTGTSILSWTNLSWTRWYNDSDALSVIVATDANPVALNISVQYCSALGNAFYVGLLAFYVSLTSGGESLYYATTPSLAVPSSPLTVSNSTLPLPILLSHVGGGSLCA